MNKTWLVLRNEVTTTVSRRSWIFVAFGVPLIAVLILFGVSLLRGGSSPVSSGATGSQDPRELRVEGYVDHSGLVKQIPEAIQGKLLPYPDESSAQAALEAGEIPAYYIVPQDYVQSGDLVYIDPDYMAFSPERQAWVMEWTLLFNMLNGDTKQAGLVWTPMNLEVTALSDTPQREAHLGPAYWIAYATGLILYVVIILASSLLRSSMGNERKNRTLENLMLSVTPQQLLTGKTVALAIVGLLQTMIWAGTGYAALRLGGQALRLPPGSQLPLSVMVWSLVFFLLGYAVYATLLAGLGALTGPNVAGASTADFAIIWPLLIPLPFVMVLIQQPHGALAVALSLFPLTAPVAMTIRLAAAKIPLWQPLLAAGLMAITAFFTVRAVARVFRAQMLLSGQPVTLKRYVAALLGRA